MTLNRTPLRRTPAVQPNSEDENHFSAPTAQVFEDVDGEDLRAQPSADDRLEQMAQALADMQSQLAESQRANMAAFSQPQGSSPAADTFTPEDASKIKLPDPALDPDGYAAAIDQRQSIKLQNEQRRQQFVSQQEQTNKARVDNLWADFNDAYPDLADHQDRIDYIATTIANENHKRGVNLERYMFSTPTKFFRDVAAKYNEVFGSDDNNAEPSRAASRNRTRRTSADDDWNPGRTAGIPGGSGDRSARRQPEDESGGNMMDDIQKLQRSTGFF